MADRSTQSQGGRSRGRAKAKTPHSASASVQAAEASHAPPVQQAPPQGPSQPQLAGRATTMPSAPGASRRQPGPSVRKPPGGGGDADLSSQLSSQLGPLNIKDDPPQTAGRGGVRGRREIVPAIRTRPPTLTTKIGKYGATQRYQANYFKLLTHTDWCLYQYRVDFEPDEERTGIRKKLLSVHREKFGGYIFDGSTMWTTCLVRPDPMELFSQRESDGANIRIKIKKTVDLSVGDHAYIQLFNVITRKCLEYLDLQLVGRDYFNPKFKVTIHEFGMELWPGYSTSIRQHEDSILMNVEVTHKVMRLQTVLNIYQEAYNRDSRNYRDIFVNAVVGSTVMTDYNQKTYRIDDVDFESSPRDTFDMKGNKTSYIDYYQKRYGIRIVDSEQPLLISRTKKRDLRAGMAETILLIPELCRATGLTDEMRSNVQLMKALADRTRIPPSGRIKKLREFLSNMHKNTKVNEEFNMWNLKLDKDLIDFNGRCLPPEKILHGNNRLSEGNMDADFTGNLRDQSLILPVSFKSWSIIIPSRVARDGGNFANILSKAARSLYFDIPQPRMEEIRDDRAGTYCEALDRIVANMNPQLIMCILISNRADKYSAIKKKACVDRCVPTQVVLAKNISSQNKRVMSIATKIAIQLNCKIGGAPWSVEIPLSGVMVVGFDTSHDTTNKTKSFGATVCSLNKSLTQYYSAVAAHSEGQELSNQIATHISNGCIKYKECSGALPNRVIIYRDGVGDGQHHMVITHEVNDIRNKLKELYGGEEPKIAVIIVTKRINTRIFKGGENPSPGTVVDDVITSPDRYDFFLISQSVRQGTVSPTSYNVIYDTTGLLPDHMQRFTYKLTHLYYNWSGTVRVPAPCQYAHKLALLVGQAIHKPPAKNLADRLFFL